MSEQTLPNAKHQWPKGAPVSYPSLVLTCPQQALPALNALYTFLGDLRPAALQDFVYRVLYATEIGADFVRCRASREHHHQEPGGLLIHSVEGLPVIETLARWAQLDEPSIGLCQVGYLFHDIGKVWTIGVDGAQFPGARFLRHESQTAVLLQPYLERLARSWPDGAAVLRYIWDFLAIPASTRGYAKFVGAEIVAWTDQLSVATERGRSITSLLGGSFQVPDMPCPKSINAFEGI